MADTYERVRESANLTERILRAETIVQEEALLNPVERRNYQWFPRYLQILQTKEEQTEEWTGMSGQIAKVKAEAVQTSGKIRRIEENISQIESTLASQIEQVRRHHQETMSALTKLLESSTNGAPR